MKRTAITGFVLSACFAAFVARPEMSPRAYESMREKAPELMELVVLNVDTETREFPNAERPMEGYTDTRVEATARVISVIRTKSNLQPGDSIRITYTSRVSAMPGPGPVRVLKKDEKVHAYLKSGPGAYQPAAMGASFDRR